MSIRVIAAAVFAAYSSFSAAAPLPQVVEKVLQTSPDVQTDVGQRRASDSGVDVAKAGYYPKIDFMLGAGYQYTKDQATRQSNNGGGVNYDRQGAQALLSQMLFDGNQTTSEVARRTAIQKSAAHKVANTSEDLSLKVTEAYLDVLRYQELLKLTQANLDAHLRTQDQVKLRTSGGFGKKSDDDQINARVALAKSNLSAAQSSLNEAQIAYLRFVGEAPEDLLKPEDPKNLPATLKEAGDWAVKNNRLLMSAQADAEAAEAQFGVAQGQMYPRLDLEAGAIYENAEFGVEGPDATNVYGMLRMRYAFKSGADKAHVAETKSQFYSAQELARRVERQIRQNAELSWNAMTIAAEQVPILAEYAESSKLARDEYSKQFTLGQRSLLDLLDSENEYFTASRDLVDGEYKVLRAKFRLLADGTNLLNTFGVQPLVETQLPDPNK